MSGLGTKLVQMGPKPVVLTFEDGEEVGPVQTELINVQNESVYSLINASFRGEYPYIRISGEMQDTTLSAEAITQPPKSDDVEELLDDDEIFEEVRTVVDIESGI